MPLRWSRCLDYCNGGGWFEPSAELEARNLHASQQQQEEGTPGPERGLPFTVLAEYEDLGHRVAAVRCVCVCVCVCVCENMCVSVWGSQQQGIK